MTNEGRWAGRSLEKDELRNIVWHRLEETGIAVSHIPNFAGADMAAWRLSQTDAWKAARMVKCNPDPPQIPLRMRALYEGKTLFCPVPELTKSFPYLRIDPARLIEKGVTFELAATAEGYMLHGERIDFDDVPRLDFCIVGSVAVSRSGGRTGKGAGFADLETGIFRELGIIGPETPMATSIHSSHLVPETQMTMLAHDSPLDYIATEQELIVVANDRPRPTGVAWDRVQADQYDNIPFLTTLRQRLERS